jgi:hypothetical protein
MNAFFGKLNQNVYMVWWLIYVLYNMSHIGVLNIMGRGGGTIKRQSTCALLLIIGMTMSIFPLTVGAVNPVASSNSATIGLNENKHVLEVHAATKKKVKKTYKKVKAATKKKVKKTYKKVKAASSYKSSYYTSSGTADTSSDPTLNAIMQSDAGFGYSHAYHTAADLEKHHAGDCWAFSADLNSKFQAAGYQSRIIQYATSYASNHRSVQLYQNGAWKTVPYRAYGYPYLIV